jgi:integrase
MAKTGALHCLTAREVRAAGDGDLIDGGGLTLRVRDGRAAWVLRYTAPTGRRREMGMGVCPRGSVEQAGRSLTTARGAAHEARETLRRGIDPLDERDRHREAARAAEAARKAAIQSERWTLARSARDYHARAIEPRRTPMHAAQWISSLENHMPATLWHAPIASVTAPALLSALVAITPHERARRNGKLAETVRRIRQRLEAVFDDAEFLGRCTGNPARSIRRHLAEQGPQAPRGDDAQGQRALSYRETAEFVRTLRAAPGTAARALEFLTLCAARTGEVIGATWAEIDWDAATWTLPPSRMKARKAHVVPLSPRAVDILRAQVGQDATWVFPSPASMNSPEGDRRPLSNMAMLVTLDRIGWRSRTSVHGLRAAFSTWANETNAARPDVIEAALAHVEGNAVRRAYLRAEFEAERRELLRKWEGYLTRPALALVAA